METIVQKPTWVDENLYPFESKFFNLPNGQMHFIDEGNGDVLLFVHGTPTWSFLYRNLIKNLSKDFRCIAIDHLGFGLSRSNGQNPGTPQSHAQNLIALIEFLDLKDITLVVHDFGGPIGLGAGIHHSGRIKNIVLFNSWLWGTKDNIDALKIDKLINGWLGRTLYLNFNFSPKVLLKKGFTDKQKLTKAIHQQYIKPFPDKASRMPLLNIAKALVGASDWYEEQWHQLDKLTSKNWLILWGTKDEFITTAYLQKWRKRLLKSKVVEIDAGHFVQEEKPGKAIKNIREFLETHHTSSDHQIVKTDNNR
ncbi:MAG: alpha/beta fold hydrolase [Bacteroidota bacterium]